MTRRTFAPAPVAPHMSAGARAAGVAQRPAATTPAQGRAEGQGRNGALRSTRRGFVLGAAAGLGAILLGGGLLERLGAVTASVAGGTTGASGTSGAGSASGAGDTSTATGAGGTSSGASSGQPESPTPVSTPGSTATAALVTVDSASCIGCGRCLDVCPAGVFS